MPIWKLQQRGRVRGGMSRDGLDINGLDTMQKKLNYISTRYPYESEILLIKMGNKFRNSVKKKTPDSGVASKRKLMKSYRVSKVQGAGKDLYVEFRSTSPHFHLVERGHKIADKNGKDTGKRVQGKFMVEQTALEYQKAFPKEVEKMVENLLRGIK